MNTGEINCEKIRKTENKTKKQNKFQYTIK